MALTMNATSSGVTLPTDPSAHVEEIPNARPGDASAGVELLPNAKAGAASSGIVPISTTSGPTDSQKLAAVFLGILAGDNYPQQLPQPPAFGSDQLDADRNAYTPPAPAQEQQAAAATTSPATAGGGGTGDWRTDVLKRVGAPVTPDNLHVLDLWQRAEGGGSDGPSHSAFNWLNTTRTAPDAPYTGVINSVGVKNYASYDAGINATVGALQNGRYGNVIAALMKGNDAFGVAEAIANSPWGTGNGVVRLLQGGSGGVPHGGGRIN